MRHNGPFGAVGGTRCDRVARFPKFLELRRLVSGYVAEIIGHG